LVVTASAMAGCGDKIERFAVSKLSRSRDPVHVGTAFLVPRLWLDVLGAIVEDVDEVDVLRG
jgi:hypothetical protein